MTEQTEQTEQKNNDLTALHQAPEHTQKEGLSEKEASENTSSVDSTAVTETPVEEIVKPAPKNAQSDEKDVPVFSGGQFVPQKENQQEAEESLDDLEAQLLRTAWKNKFMAFEDEEANKGKKESQWHFCPFGQCLPQTITRNENPPYVSMELKSGAVVKNASKQVNITFEEDAPSFEDCMTMARIGMEKGWKTAKLEGPEEYKAQMYLAMRAMGIKAIGYTPSPELEKQGDELAAKHEPDRIHAEDMDRRYPALDKARGDMPFEKVDAKEYAEIRAKANGNQAEQVQTAEKEEAGKTSASSEMKGMAAEMAHETGVDNSLFSKKLKDLNSENEVDSEAAMDKFLTKNTFKKMLKGYDKLPDEKKEELAGKLEKMVGNLVEKHPQIATKLAYDLSSGNKKNGSGPAKMLQAYGAALNSVKEAEAKGHETTKEQTQIKNPKRVQNAILNATRRLSGIEK
ncbi:MAG: hypothetical protein IKR09_03150 [Alphaproteobacteria bacterium]|nr:hypothetical protein [Alphaproteobacteria bacterium]